MPATVESAASGVTYTNAVKSSEPPRTTSWSRFYLLRQERSLWSPSLVYSARSAWGSALTRPANGMLERALRQAPLRRQEPPTPPPPPDPEAIARMAASLPAIEDGDLRQALARLGTSIKQK